MAKRADGYPELVIEIDERKRRNNIKKASYGGCWLRMGIRWNLWFCLQNMGKVEMMRKELKESGGVVCLQYFCLEQRGFSGIRFVVMDCCGSLLTVESFKGEN